MGDSAYISIELVDFEKHKKEGIEEAKANGDEEHITWPNLDWAIETSEIEFKEGKLFVYGNLRDSKDLTNFGYLSVDFQLPLDIVIDVIEFYMKKLGKLKTIIEATKG